MKPVRVRVNDDGTLHLPVDNIVAGLDPFADRLIDRIGLLPRRRPPSAVPKRINAADSGANANRVLSSVDARLMGWALRETTGAANAKATIELRAGSNETGDLIVPLTLSSGQSNREWFGPNGIACAGGLYLVRVLGSVDGSVWLGEI